MDNFFNIIGNTGLVFSILFFIVISGFFRIRRSAVKLMKDENTVTEFRNDFINWSNGECRDRGLYTSLISRSMNIQVTLGSIGIISSYRPPYQNFIYRRWEIILNAIPEIQSQVDFDRVGLMWPVISSYMQMVDDCLVRYLGIISEEIDRVNADLRNPIVWSREGARWVFSIPILLLSSLGVLGGQFAKIVVNSYLFKMMSGLFAIATFVALVFGLIVDTPQAIQTLTEWFRSFIKI
jgi:hypothetical protein